MGKGYHEESDYTGDAHCTIYNDEGRESWDENSQGDITGDHVTLNEDQDQHYDLPDSSEANNEYTPESQYDEDNGPDPSDYRTDNDD